MKAFDKFKKIHGAPRDCEKVSERQLESYKDKLPDNLLEEWKETGFCSYNKGLIWTVDPETYEDILSDWLDESEECFAFARTAFGSVFFRRGADNYFLDVLNKDVSRVFDRVDYVFDGTLCDDDYLDDVILRPLFKEALEEFGVLARNECYGVFPAPELGGEIALENLKKVKIREYLAILSQL